MESWRATWHAASTAALTVIGNGRLEARRSVQRVASAHRTHSSPCAAPSPPDGSINERSLSSCGRSDARWKPNCARRRASVRTRRTPRREHSLVRWRARRGTPAAGGADAGRSSPHPPGQAPRWRAVHPAAAKPIGSRCGHDHSDDVHSALGDVPIAEVSGRIAIARDRGVVGDTIAESRMPSGEFRRARM